MPFQSLSGRSQAARQHRALSTWRSTARLVRECWGDCLAADRAGRVGAFAAYDAALDLEAAAADELAVLALKRVA